MIKQEKLLERIEHIANKYIDEINPLDDWEVGWLAGQLHVMDYLTTILELYYNEQNE